MWCLTQRMDERFSLQDTAPAAAPVDLTQCLQLFLQRELLDNENTWYIVHPVVAGGADSPP